VAALVHFDAQGRWGETLVCEQRIAQALQERGLDFGRLPVRDAGSSLESALAAYAPELARLRERLAVRSIDRVTPRPDPAEWPRLRAAFLAEHTHAEPEIRFFLGGTGLFHLRDGDGFLGLLCEAGDWVAVPAGLPHRFDGGEAPAFDALRLFGSPDGWAARPTGAALPALPLLDAFTDHLLELTGHALDEGA